MSPPFAIAVRCVDSQLLPLERTINQGAQLQGGLNIASHQ